MTVFSAFIDTIVDLLNKSGIVAFFSSQAGTTEAGDPVAGWKFAVMIGISFVLMYLAIAKEFEPLLLLPIAFGMFLANLPVAGLSAHVEGGLIYYLYYGVKMVIYPPLIFLGIGTMTDFGPLIANPKSFL